MSKNKLIPALRFPEFQGEGEWEFKAINEVFNSFSGGTPNTSEREYYGGAIPFIRSAEINKFGTELFLTEKGLKNSSAKLVNAGDLLVALYGANSGDVAISKIYGAINQAVLCLQSEYSNSFAYNFLAFRKDWIISKFIQGGQGNLSGEIIKSIIIPFPSKPEQQKIAACLSSLDEIILAENQKLALLKDHKKGLMQNLFPQEGEKTPKVRFPEFWEDGAWKERKLGEVGEFSSGGTPSKLIPEFWGGTIPWISASSMHNISLSSSESNITKYAVDSGAPIVPKGTILILVRGSMLFNRVPIGVTTTDASFNQDVKAIKLNHECFTEYIMYHLLAYEKYIPIDKTGIGAGKIELNELKRLALFLPKTMNEQQKIAACLSSLDALIAAQADKIAQLQLHKKGLMQGLFPKTSD